MHFISGAPKERKGYLALIAVFDSLTWAWLLVSLVSVSIALVIINKIHGSWSNISSNETAYQSRENTNKEIYPILT